MNRYTKPLGGSLAALLLTACTGGQTTPPSSSSVNVTSPAVSSVQFAVGTANIGGTATGMNVLAMLRQANGLSGVLVSTPKLTGPFTFTQAGIAAPDATAYDASSTADQGPSTAEVAGGYIGGSPQIQASAVNPSTPYTTFGTSGGLFQDGFAPDNYNSNGAPDSFGPYNEPLYAGEGNQATFVPWGGPPAFDPNGTGQGTLGSTGTKQICIQLSGGACTHPPGISLGLNVFSGVTAAAGTYTLAVNIPTGTSGSGTVTQTDAAAPALLPTFVTPTVVFSQDAVAGADATITYALPAGVVGAYIQVADLGPADPDSTNFLGQCNSGSTVYYTAWETSSGAFVINSNYGPNAKKGPAICDATYYASQSTPEVSAVTGTPLPTDTLQVVGIGFDYDQYALQEIPGAGAFPQKPAIPATADVTISPIGFFPNPGAAYLTALHKKMAARARR